MIEGIGKYVGGKVLTAILVVAVAVVVIGYVRLEPARREALWATVRAVLLWIGLAAMLPWALFFVPPLVVRAESNLVSVLALVGYLLIDVLLALWLADWSVSGTLAWAVLILGFLGAAVYNYMVCEFFAERAEDSM